MGKAAAVTTGGTFCLLKFIFLITQEEITTARSDSEDLMELMVRPSSNSS